MAKALMKVIMKIVTSFIDIILTPINALVVGIFPNFAQSINYFNAFVEQYIGGSIAYFSSILPTKFRQVLYIWLVFLISYYSVAWSYALIVKIYNVIRKIKFW